MQRRATGARSLFVVSFVTIGALLTVSAGASTTKPHAVTHGHHHAASVSRHKRYAAWQSLGISCVPFAREESGIDLPGNARDWWDNAVGVYARGSVPEPGSVLAFSANWRMPLGHVAVVARVISRREIEVDQANWGVPGAVSRGVVVVDVSDENDWSAVRVEIGKAGKFGAIYPTHGFIYDRPDTGRIITVAAAPAPAPELNPATLDLRSFAESDDQIAGPPPSRNHAGGHHLYKVTSHSAPHRRRVRL